MLDRKGHEYKEGWNKPDRQTVEIYDYRIPEVEDCSNGYIPENLAEKKPVAWTAAENNDGEKEVLVVDAISFTKYLFSHYKGALYLELCKWLRNGRLSKIVGFPVLNSSINKAACTFPDVAYWRIDRENFYADIAVDMNIQTPTGTKRWKGYLILWCSFEEGFSYTVEDMNPCGHTEKDGFDRLSSFLVPIYTNKRMDEISEEMLKKHMPEALTDPSKRNAVKMAYSMGLSVMYLPLYEEDKAESVLFFEERWVLIGDPDAQSEAKYERINAILGKLDPLITWAEDIKAYALHRALSGYAWDDWKAVEGRSNRTFTDEESVATVVTEAGFNPYEKKLLGITAMERMLGKARFRELLGSYVTRPQGKPTLVARSDKRPELSATQTELVQAN